MHTKARMCACFSTSWNQAGREGQMRPASRDADGGRWRQMEMEAGEMEADGGREADEAGREGQREADGWSPS